MTRKSLEHQHRVAVFAGSFRPFTVGHADIVRRGLTMFDNIIICVGINVAKPADADSAAERAAHLREVYASEPRVTVECWGGLTCDFVKAKGAAAILRGVRSVKDFEYEKDMAEANRRLSGVETVVLFSDPDYAWVSSSLVRELQAFDHDTSQLIL